MSSGCGDVLSLEDLRIAKLHQLFEAEVITGLQGGVAGGAAIDYATNQVTGQSQKTLPAVLRDAGFTPASFTFATGGTLGVNDANVAVLYPTEGQYYIWHGALPKVIPAASTPTSTGGISATGWVPWGDLFLRGNLAAADGRKLIGKCATVADLRITEPTSPNQWIDVTSYTASSKHAQGTYRYDATDSTSADNAGTIIVTTAGARWKFIGTPTVETYGAYGDGTTPDSTAIKRCIQAEDKVIFGPRKYNIDSSLQPVRTQQIFQGAAGTILTTLTGGRIFEFILTYREGVQFRDFTLMSETPGSGIGFYSTSAVYIANPVLQNINFHASLSHAINANMILEVVRDCRFGLEGTLGASYQHILMAGQAPTGSNLTTNAGLYENCRFFRSNSAYGIDMVNGLQKIFVNCDFETNNNTAGIIRQAGMLSFHFDKCWWERNAGVQLVKVQMDSVGTLQGNAVTTFDKCWIKLDGTGNTCVLLSDTPNFNVSFTHCAGTGFAGKNLFMVNATANPLQYLKSFMDNYFVGFTLLPQNTAWLYELGVNLLEFRDTVTGAKLGVITANSNRAVLAHDVGLAIQKQDGTLLCELVITATGLQIRARGQDGTMWKLQPPTSGSTPTAAQWTVV